MRFSIATIIALAPFVLAAPTLPVRVVDVKAIQKANGGAGGIGGAASANTGLNIAAVSGGNAAAIAKSPSVGGDNAASAQAYGNSALTQTGAASAYGGMGGNGGDGGMNTIKAKTTPPKTAAELRAIQKANGGVGGAGGAATANSGANLATAAGGNSLAVAKAGSVAGTNSASAASSGNVAQINTGDAAAAGGNGGNGGAGGINAIKVVARGNPRMTLARIKALQKANGGAGGAGGDASANTGLNTAVVDGGNAAAIAKAHEVYGNNQADAAAFGNVAQIYTGAASATGGNGGNGGNGGINTIKVTKPMPPPVMA